MRLIITLFSFALLLAACGETASKAEAMAEDTMKKVEETVKPSGIKITPFSNSPEFPDATITDVSYKNGTFNFDITASDYALGEQTSDADIKMCANSGQGQHIHLIMNNQPYAAKYESTFDYDLPDGEHYMLAFLSRSYHESIKTDAAHVAKKVTVKDKNFTAATDLEEPMLFYSRPKGSYVGSKATQKVMLDFYPVNVSLGANAKVAVKINNEFETTLDKWEPVFIEGLPMGENTVELTLVDGSGNKMDVPLNPVSRTFTLAADPAEEN